MSPGLSVPELFHLRSILLGENRKSFTPREREILAGNDARRKSGELAEGARHVLDIQALRAFASANGLPVPIHGLHLPGWDELLGNDLLVRYGWIGAEAGLAFSEWEVRHQREMLEVFKHIRRQP
jgi:hypothetical protein